MKYQREQGRMHFSGRPVGTKTTLKSKAQHSFHRQTKKKKMSITNQHCTSQLLRWPVYALIDNNHRPLLLFKVTGGLSFTLKQNTEWSCQPANPVFFVCLFYVAGKRHRREMPKLLLFINCNSVPQTFSCIRSDLQKEIWFGSLYGAQNLFFPDQLWALLSQLSADTSHDRHVLSPSLEPTCPGKWEHHLLGKQKSSKVEGSNADSTDVAHWELPGEEASEVVLWVWQLEEWGDV